MTAHQFEQLERIERPAIAVLQAEFLSRAELPAADEEQFSLQVNAVEVPCKELPLDESPRPLRTRRLRIGQEDLIVFSVYLPVSVQVNAALHPFVERRSAWTRTTWGWTPTRAAGLWTTSTLPLFKRINHPIAVEIARIDTPLNAAYLTPTLLTALPPLTIIHYPIAIEIARIDTPLNAALRTAALETPLLAACTGKLGGEQAIVLLIDTPVPVQIARLRTLQPLLRRWHLHSPALESPLLTPWEFPLQTALTSAALPPLNRIHYPIAVEIARIDTPLESPLLAAALLLEYLFEDLEVFPVDPAVSVQILGLRPFQPFT